jgi:hypothetical protein
LRAARELLEARADESAAPTGAGAAAIIAATSSTHLNASIDRQILSMRINPDCSLSRWERAGVRAHNQSPYRLARSRDEQRPRFVC